MKNALLEIKLRVAGVVKKEIVMLSTLKLSEESIELSGTHKTEMSVFGLKSPSALWGMVKANDEIEIDFSIILEKN